MLHLRQHRLFLIPPRASAPSSGLSILIAEEEPSRRQAVAEYLRGAGHRVLESQSPDHALERARANSSLDVLLADVLMLGLRGTELARQIPDSHPGVRVIDMCGLAQNIPEAQIPPGAAFLQKPFRFTSLAEQLKLVPR